MKSLNVSVFRSCTSLAATRPVRTRLAAATEVNVRIVSEGVRCVSESTQGWACSVRERYEIGECFEEI
jgi:hypothetical protein